jgi:cytochrome c-type biogenesis protein
VRAIQYAIQQRPFLLSSLSISRLSAVFGLTTWVNANLGLSATQPIQIARASTVAIIDPPNSSPCASLVLFTVLAAAAATGSPLRSVLIMVSYALGYTAVIFCASLLTELVKQSRVLLQNSGWMTGTGSVMLILAGIYYVVSGIRWFFWHDVG